MAFNFDWAKITNTIKTVGDVSQQLSQVSKTLAGSQQVAQKTIIQAPNDANKGGSGSGLGLLALAFLAAKFLK